MDVTKPKTLIKIGAMDVTKPNKLLAIGAGPPFPGDPGDGLAIARIGTAPEQSVLPPGPVVGWPPSPHPPPTEET